MSERRFLAGPGAFAFVAVATLWLALPAEARAGSPTITGTPSVTGTPTVSSSSTATRTPTAVTTPTYTPQVYQLLPDKNVFSPRQGQSLAIRFVMADVSRLRIFVYNSAGEFIRQMDERFAALTPTAGGLRFADDVWVWDGRNFLDEPVASGVYVIRMEAKGLKRFATVAVAN